MWQKEKERETRASEKKWKKLGNLVVSKSEHHNVTRKTEKKIEQ